MDKRIPVTVLTGDFHAGKTVLRNRILAEDRARRYALLVDAGQADAVELAATGIAGQFIVRTKEELFEMNSGCICCTIRGDLIRALHVLLEEESGNFDAVIIETAGSADPGPIIQTFFVDHILEQHTGLDSVIAVVDADTIVQELQGNRAAMQQIAFADQVVPANTEALDGAALEALQARLRRINPLALIQQARPADIALEALLDRGAFELERGAALAGDFAMPPQVAGKTDDNEISAVLLEADVAMEFDRVDEWLAGLVMRQGTDLLRGKGVIDVIDRGGDRRRLAFQSVQMLHEGNFPRTWAADEPHASRLVFVGRNLDLEALQTGFMACAASGAATFALVSAA
ncbi:MAG TPA: GTP-binding protein [Herbaspirillum sp.]|jgi:G3E family GTPase